MSKPPLTHAIPSSLPRGDRRRMRIGLLGGSFNPAHAGHLHISLDALRRLRLHQIWWMVSPQNPLKASTGMASLKDRMASCHGIARHPNILVTDIETKLGTQYTSATLAELQKRFPAADFVWIMGADNLAQVHKWDRWLSVMGAVPVAVFDRSPYSYDALASLGSRRFRGMRLGLSKGPVLAGRRGPSWIFVTLRRHPESATRLRQTGAWQAGAKAELVV